MVEVNFRTDETLMSELFDAMKSVENTGKLIGNDLVFQTSNKFITSATVATKPGSKGSISGESLPAKSRIRKVVTVGASRQKASNRNVYFDNKTRKIRTLKESYTPRRAKERGLIRITKFFQAIKRKDGTPYLIPIKPGEDKDTSKNRFIPKAGSAKAGWLAARQKLNAKGEKSINRISPKVNTMRRDKSWTEPSIFMENNVRYTSKVSPNSARLGLAKAARAMEQQYLPKADRLITKAFNERRKTMLARTGIVIR